MLHRIGIIAFSAFIAASAGALAPGAQAAGLGDFYKGKTITIYIGYGFGGTYGKYSRTMAEHLAKHIEGNPNIIVKSQPGAGGIKMTNYAYTAMPRGGYHWLMPPDTVVVSELLRPKKVRYRAKEFTWLGSSNQTNTIFVLRADSGVTKWQDMKTTEVVVGNTGPGSTSFLIPRMAKEMLGLKIKQVSGYKGSSKTILAMEQGEHQGTGFNWLAWSSKVSHWFKPGKDGKQFANAILQTGVWKDPDLPNVPMLRDLVEEKHKPIVAFMATLGIIGRGLALPPGAPKEIVGPLRAAFDKMVKDPAYIADTKKRRLRVYPTPGADIQDFVTKAYANANPEVVAAARKMIFGK
ncbi:MAG: tripartite tricarboxylate transporter substrate-binding protein [Alphaproteobacteria bacterium]|nr:tripartite tricarboxylate transporter substrate-binding protein [Alphaproteobacteria bacterium]